MPVNKDFLYLKKIFLRDGYLRMQDETKVGDSQKYKKGSEVRFKIRDGKELKKVRKSIAALGYTVSHSFIKHKHFIIQPLYGKDITLKFKKIMDSQN